MSRSSMSRAHLACLLSLAGCHAKASATHHSVAAAICGNNVRQGLEVCDGTDLAGEDCASQGFTTGELACAPDCKAFVFDGCCRPNCSSRACGLDPVCGASCGTCAEGSVCDDQGQCGSAP